MTQQVINVGSAINDGTGDPARTAFTKSNDNFTELYPRDVPQCGRLVYVSASALSFAPYNGDRIKINGVIYPIPSAGIAGLANTSVVVASTPGQNLAASTTYTIFAFNAGGVITANYIAGTSHATSATAGNVGTEIYPAADSMTLIGMVRTNASSQFVDTAANRSVLSWFNRRNIDARGANTAGAITVSTTAVALTAAANVLFLTWGEEAVALGVEGTSSSSVDHGVNGSNIYLDGPGQLPQGVLCNCGGIGAFGSNSGSICVTATEGFHTISPMGYVLGGTGSFYIACSAMIRG